MSTVVLWGGTGQAKVVKPILESEGNKVEAIIDDTPGLIPPFSDIKVYQGFEKFKEEYNKKGLNNFNFIVTIGNSKKYKGEARVRLSRLLKTNQMVPINAIDKSALINESVKYGEGLQVMSGVIVMPLVKIGDYCILNTGAQIDHECVLEEGVEIGPGAVLAGEIKVGKNSWVGSGAVILPKLKIGDNVVIGAGAVVTKDVPDNVIMVGIPARIMEEKNES